MQAVILAGGFGTRLSHVVSDVPKPMAPINNRPFLECLINLLKENGFNDFVLLTGYKSEIIEQYFHNDLKIKCVVESKPLGTAGAIFNAFPLLKEEFYVINGDTFFDIDFSIMQEFAEDKPALMALRYSQDISRYGLVNLSEEYLVNEFAEKGNLPEHTIDGYINGGICYFKKKTLADAYKKFVGNNISLENDIFPILVKNKSLYGLPMGGAFIDIGIPEDYYKAQSFIDNTLKQKKKPAVFVDKDGTLIINTEYPHGEEIQIISDTIPILQKYNEAGYIFIMVTNQAGIAKNKFTHQAMIANINAIKKYYKNHGINFSVVEYCPYHQNALIAEYKFKSKARKPEPGMILSACEKVRVDLKNSIMIGDNKEVDTIKLPYLKSLILGEKNV